VSKNRLAGRVVLVVEDEPLVALEVTAALRAAGARVLTAGYLETGLFTTDNPEVSAAVIDLQLSDGNGTAICRRLHHLGVPFVIHTGFPQMLISGEWLDAPVISKPTRPEQIISALIGLLR
jgi:DNA-binding response OmpR family regulator